MDIPHSGRHKFYDEPSPKRPYKSFYGGGYIASAQYLAECLCWLLAQQDGVKLPVKFWNDNGKWQQAWRRANADAHKLLQQYDHQVIVKSLRDRRCSRIQFLGSKTLERVLKENQVIHDRQMETLLKTESPMQKSTTSHPRKPMKKKNVLNKLRELDGEEETGNQNRPADQS